MRIVIKGDTIESLELEQIKSGSIQYYEAELEFDEQWNGLEKKAIVVSKDEEYAKEIEIADNKLYLNIEENDVYCIGFIGYIVEDEKKIKQISTNLRMLTVSKGAGQVRAEQQEVPTPTEWELYIQQIKEICNDLHAENIKFADEETLQEKYDNGKFDGENKEDKTNKVTSINANSTDEQYPSAKCVYDLVGNIEYLLGGI